MHGIREKFEFLLDITADDYKKKVMKKNSFKDFEKYLLRIREASREEEKCLNADEIQLGFFSINVSELRTNVR